MSASVPQAQSLRLLASALGVAQLVAWGTLYYAIAVLGAPMQKDLGLSSAELFALLGSRLSAQRLGALTFAGLLGSLLFLLASRAVPLAIVLFAVSYGAANGVITIVKAVLPVELFGTRELGAVLGRFSAPSLVARAAAPWAFASATDSPLGTMGALRVTVLVALGALLAFVVSARSPAGVVTSSCVARGHAT